MKTECEKKYVGGGRVQLKRKRKDKRETLIANEVTELNVILAFAGRVRVSPPPT